MNPKYYKWLSAQPNASGVTRTVSGELPLAVPLVSQNQNASDWTLKGDVLQNGTPTPTSIIDPQFVGTADENGNYSTKLTIDGRAIDDNLTDTFTDIDTVNIPSAIEGTTVRENSTMLLSEIKGKTVVSNGLMKSTTFQGVKITKDGNDTNLLLFDTPQELKGLNTVRDRIYIEKKNNGLYDVKKETHITRTDLGELTFAGPSNLDNIPVYHAALPGYSRFSLEVYIDDADYSMAPRPLVNNHTYTTEAGNGTRIWIRADEYATASEFRTAMSGVFCYYPLATPITETLLTDLNLEEVSAIVAPNNTISIIGNTNEDYVKPDLTAIFNYNQKYTTLTIPLGTAPLRAINENYDTISKNGERTNTIGYLELTGNESYGFIINQNLIIISGITALLDDNAISIICDRCQAVTGTQLLADINTSGINQCAILYGFIAFHMDGINTASEFITYAQAQFANGTPIKVAYVKVYADTTQVTSTNLPLYQGNNTIDSNETLKPSNLLITYHKEV